ncbi:hypothetical protein, partial [Pantoea sp. ME81]|uniref:hypothetical protein n=1 Tax=Pantoea sp. ME81 TaxID=2743935 RepID=UPI001C70F256
PSQFHKFLRAQAHAKLGGRAFTRPEHAFSPEFQVPSCNNVSFNFSKQAQKSAIIALLHITFD